MGRGGGGGSYHEPPCDDRMGVSNYINVADRVWIEQAGRTLEGTGYHRLLIVPDVPPGEWRVTMLRFKFSLGGTVYLAQVPGPYTALQLPEKSTRMAAGQVAYLGVWSLAATRDVNDHDALRVSYAYDARSEEAAWRTVLELYPGTPWAAPIEARLNSLHP